MKDNRISVFIVVGLVFAFCLGCWYVGGVERKNREFRNAFGFWPDCDSHESIQVTLDGEFKASAAKVKEVESDLAGVQEGRLHLAAGSVYDVTLELDAARLKLADQKKAAADEGYRIPN